MSEYPKDLRYRESHEWMRLSGDTATVGITGFAIAQLNDIIDIEIIKEVGEKVKAGQTIAEIESVKAASDIYAPVSGEIIEIHKGLSDQIEALTENPYTDGWMVKIRISDKKEVSSLLDAGAYSAQVAAGGH